MRGRRESPGSSLKQLAEDVDPNNDRLLRFLSHIQSASEVYEPVHRELVQKSRQALISAYFARQANAPVNVVGGESDEERELEAHDVENMSDDNDEVASIVSDVEFEGF